MKVIITGTTGMVGRSVLNECLVNDKVNEVLAVNRRSLGLNHPKLKEVLHTDFTDFSPLTKDFIGFDACFHCMGVTSLGKSEAEFSKFTYTITKSLADACFTANPAMVMNYVSGQGTDSTEKGSIMWARVKGKTENYVLNRGFRDAYMFRLGALIPEGEVSSGTGWYKYIYVLLTPLFPLLRKLSSFTTSSQFGKAMINSVNAMQDVKQLENRDINVLASR
jgi:uncharacterized protein YbjT (DUF2867 family)